MTLKDKITLLSQELAQRQKAQEARALLQNLRSVVHETNMQIQEIADSGSFGTLDVDIKNALLSAWNVSKDAQTALEDVVIKELLNWTP